MLHNSVKKVYPDFSRRNQIAVEPTRVPIDKYLSLHRAESAAANNVKCNKKYIQNPGHQETMKWYKKVKTMS